MITKKPDWSLIQLYDKSMRLVHLLHETDSHLPDCQCNLCMECYSLGELVQTFSDDESAAAVIEARKRTANEGKTKQ